MAADQPPGREVSKGRVQGRGLAPRPGGRVQGRGLAPRPGGVRKTRGLRVPGAPREATLSPW